MKLTGIGSSSFKSLDDILKDAKSSQLFVGVKPKSEPLTVDSKLLSKFKDIEAFYEMHNREPSNDGPIKEKALYRSLMALRQNQDFIESLEGHDQYLLLSGTNTDKEPGADVAFSLTSAESENSVEMSEHAEKPIFNSLDDILNFESNRLLVDIGDVSIYEDIGHIGKNKSVPYPDEMHGTRYECQDFWRYEPHFEKIKSALREGTATFNKLQTEQNLFVGDIFLLNGILCFIAEKTVEERKSKRKNYRLKLIFENGLESNMLMRSLAGSIYKDENGRQILLNDDNSLAQIFSQNLEVVSSGQIYIAKMDQVKPELSQFKNLHKIGFTRGSTDVRLLNCEDDIAFLESKVHVVAKIECKHMNPHAFEQLIHAFLYAQRLNMSLKAKDGMMYKPREWFDVELETILEIAQRIVDQSIVNFRMDNTTGKLVPK